mgnify:CR=1 FL=1
MAIYENCWKQRRSIRAFDPEKHVTAEQIQEIVQAAIQAPSWKTHRQHGTMPL